MPVVEKTSGGRSYIRPAGREFQVGDRAEVDRDVAAYLLEERGDFELVDDEEEGDDQDDEEDDDVEVCGTELSGGGTCDRPADECPYHGDDEEEG